MHRIRAILPVLLLLPVAGLAHAQLPPPLGTPPAPAANPITPERALLGKVLFWDEQLSSSRTVACGTCHQAASGGSDPRSVMASSHAVNPGRDGIPGNADDVLGSPGVVRRDAAAALEPSAVFGLEPQVTARHSPSHLNTAYSPWLFWDGRAAGLFVDPTTADVIYFQGGALENQAAVPPVARVEMGHAGRDWINVVARVAASAPLALSPWLPPDLAALIAGRDYAQLFAAAFGTPEVSSARILQAIATYERTLVSNAAPFDSLLAGTAALRADEAAGLAVFQTHCASCHSGALLTDEQFHDVGLRPAEEDSGRYAFTLDPADVRKFRTPSLRNVALRSAYMHNGRFATLAEVVEFYDRGGDFAGPNLDSRMAPLGLSAGEKSQLVAFMQRPLTDPRVAAAAAPFDQPQLYASSGLVPQLLVGGVNGSSDAPPAPVALEPAIAGNATFAVGVYGALGGAPAVLVVDDAVPPAGTGIPAAASFARVSITLAGFGASGGYGSVVLAIPADSAAWGRTLFGRWYVSDAGATGGVAASAPFRFRIFGPHGAGVASVLAAGPAALRAPRLAIAPNPFAERAAVRFTLPRASAARLAMYDVSGRRLKLLLDRPLAMPGDYAIAWDGRDAAGRPVSAGVYFARLETDAGIMSGRVVRTR